MLSFYSQRLNGVELNGSFYRMPPTTTLEKWEAGTPAGFRFCMKANRGLTYSAEGFDRAGLAQILGERCFGLVKSWIACSGWPPRTTDVARAR